MVRVNIQCLKLCSRRMTEQMCRRSRVYCITPPTIFQRNEAKCPTLVSEQGIRFENMNELFRNTYLMTHVSMTNRAELGHHQTDTRGKTYTWMSGVHLARTFCCSWYRKLHGVGKTVSKKSSSVIISKLSKFNQCQHFVYTGFRPDHYCVCRCPSS